jgi:drug/metabolite transporter (DMT)-like permease
MNPEEQGRPASKTSSPPSTWHVIAALAAVYSIWGSTYLAIHFAVETLPPFLMAGVRFVIAGGLLFVWMRMRGTPAPTRTQWRATAIMGALLLVGGNGVLAWAEQTVPSGLAALMIGTVPVWMVLLDWFRGDGGRPTAGVTLGLVLGLVGIALLVGPGIWAGDNRIDTVGLVALVFASLSWAVGSFYARRAPLPAASLLATGMEMLVGGGLLLIVGVLTGELGQLRLDHVSAQSLVAFGYLIVFGSWVGFTAYTWLLRATPPAVSSTYAYVNPVVAVFLGWALGGEALTSRTVLAAAIIVAAVVIITSQRANKSVPKPADSVPGIVQAD